MKGAIDKSFFDSLEENELTLETFVVFETGKGFTSWIKTYRRQLLCASIGCAKRSSATT